MSIQLRYGYYAMSSMGCTRDVRSMMGCVGYVASLAWQVYRAVQSLMAFTGLLGSAGAFVFIRFGHELFPLP